MNLMQDQSPGGHKEDRASFPNQIQYKVSKIHSPNPTLEKRKGGREEGSGGAWERGEECVLFLDARQRERVGEEIFMPTNSRIKRLNYP